MDERLDSVFVNGTYRSFSPVHVATSAPQSETFVHHNFDPVALAIKHGEDALELDALEAEYMLLREAIANAVLSLATGNHAPYGSDRPGEN